MKFYTHPVSSQTLLQAKDGSTVSKQWLYFRSSVLLDDATKVWQTLCATGKPQPVKTSANTRETLKFSHSSYRRRIERAFSKNS